MGRRSSCWSLLTGLPWYPSVPAPTVRARRWLRVSGPGREVVKASFDRSLAPLIRRTWRWTNGHSKCFRKHYAQARVGNCSTCELRKIATCAPALPWRLPFWLLVCSCGRPQLFTPTPLTAACRLSTTQSSVKNVVCPQNAPKMWAQAQLA